MGATRATIAGASDRTIRTKPTADPSAWIK